MAIAFDGLRDRIESVKKFRPLYVDLPLDYAEALLAELDGLSPPIPPVLDTEYHFTGSQLASYVEKCRAVWAQRQP